MVWKVISQYKSEDRLNEDVGKGIEYDRYGEIQLDSLHRLDL